MIVTSQYNSIVEMINNEKKAEKDRRLSSILSTILSPDNRSEDPQRSENDYLVHEENMFALLCIKFKLYVQMSLADRQVLEKSVREDVDILIESAQKICFAYEITEEFLNNVGDELYLLCADRYEAVFSLFIPKYKLTSNNSVNNISEDLYYLSFRTAKAFERMGYKDYSLLLLERLCELSGQRNDIRLHQILVMRVLDFIEDKDPETTLRITNKNEKFYENAHNKYAGSFYWAFGCALEKTNRLHEATGVFERCYKTRAELFGEEAWITEVSKREFFFCQFQISLGQTGKEGLIRFVQNAEDGKFSNVDYDSLRIVEGKTLYVLLITQTAITDLDTYDNLLEIYEDICKEFDHTEEPALKRRIATTLRGIYYMNRGDYIQAERAFVNAISRKVPENVLEIFTVPQIKIKLLSIYVMQNDTEMAIPLLLELLELLDSDTQRTGLSEKDRYNLYSLYVILMGQNMVDPDEDELRDLKELLDLSCTYINMMSSELADCKRELAVFTISSISLVLQLYASSKDDQQLYFDTLCKIDGNKEDFSLDKNQLVVMYYVFAALSWNLGRPETERFFLEALQLSKTAALPFQTRIAISQSYASFSARQEQYTTAEIYADKALQCMGSMWKSCVRYMNDERLMQILVPVQVQFMSCYAVLRTLSDAETAYEKVLQFKELASLAGRERNRIIHGTMINKQLLREIKSVQDKIATLETEGLFRDNSIDYNNEKADLRKLEALFAQRFPENNDFTLITYENVRKAIPDNSVVIEYYYCALSYGCTQFDKVHNSPHLGFDVFITQKKGGECHLSKLTIKNGERILSAADEFVSILQAESNGTVSIEQLDKVATVRATLYKSLIAPVLSSLHGYKTVFIAPDQNLINLPFEIIYDEGQKRLGELSDVVKIECARDFLYKIQGGERSDEYLIIGNPMFNVREQELGVKKNDEADISRSINIDVDKIKQLPFSQIEVERIGMRLRSRYYSGLAAGKRLLTVPHKKYNTIHIATHGYFDLSNASNKEMYSSCLLFSGVCNWIKHGTINAVYGNGIVTADEISRLDLRGTELVVLSSCLSGMNEVVLNKGFLGMISAFSAAGVHYVISNLWEADDFSTAVLMDAFYYYYAEKNLSPPKALTLAKEYLMQASIGDLKRGHWFELARQNDMDASSSQQLNQYERMDDEIRPFKGEAYWGGLVCYQCY